MVFKKIATNNIGELSEFLYHCNYRLCDYTPCVLLLWRDFYDYAYCIEDDALYISEMRDFKTYFLLPIVKNGGDLKSAIKKLLHFCCQNNIPFKLSAVPEAYINEVADVCGCCPAEMGPEDIDYAYLFENLSTLKGHRFNSKRNHVNRFKKDFPNAEFCKLTSLDKPLLLDFLDEYHKDGQSDTYSYDREAVLKFVKNFDSYPFCGGAIKLDGKIIAFSFGDQIGDTLFVHIEKALRSFSGLYETINLAFVNAFAAPNTYYVNREEDMGDNGLREAKLSYHPILFKKYSFNIC